MNEQRDQTSTDIVIVAVVILVLVLVLQLKPVQLIVLKIEARVDAAIASLCRNKTAAENLTTLADWIDRADRDQGIKVDLDKAKAYHRAYAAEIFPYKLAIAALLSVAAIIFMVRCLYADWRKAQMKLEGPDPKMDPLEAAKQLILKRAPKYTQKVNQAENPQALYDVYAEIRREINIPNNLIARCWPYASRERRLFLDCQRDLVLKEERK